MFCELCKIEEAVFDGWIRSYDLAGLPNGLIKRYYMCEHCVRKHSIAYETKGEAVFDGCNN